MLFWKRIEIYCGFSQKDFSEFRNALALSNIPYDYKIVTDTPRHHRIRMIDSNLNRTTLYYLYVHSKDYDKAMHSTSNRHCR